MDLHLNDRVAIVTGGSRGLGRAICQALAAEGAKVAVNYRQSQAAADELVAELGEQHGATCRAVQADVSREADILRLFAETEEHLGPVDVLVNNAGIWPKGWVKDLTEAEWNNAMQTNLTSAFLCSRELVNRCLADERPGRIVNVASVVGFLGSTSGHAHYAASKAGMVALTVSLAREMAPHGIGVNAVAPGMFRTDMAAEALAKNEAAYVKRIPLGRIGAPAELATVVAFLCSDRSGYMTGATVDVSGGMLMR